MNFFRFYGVQSCFSFALLSILKFRKMDLQIKHYENKLAFEMDPSDLFDALNNNEKVVPLDARKQFGFELKDHLEAIVIVIVLVTTIPVFWKLFFGKKKEETKVP